MTTRPPTALLPGLALVAAGAATTAQVKIPEAEARTHLAAFAKTYTDQASWERRAARIRRGIRTGAGLVPWPRRTPLRPVIHGEAELDGYRVANVYFESFPGFFVTGNLYRPAKEEEAATTRSPIILCPHGHWKDGRFREDMQMRCGTLARMGAVVFAYDMVGWQESAFQVDHRGDPHTLTYQTWNSIRALDFLLSLPQTDPHRVAITGASGGGTQTFLLAALDPRVTVSVPVVMVSAHFYGGCNCESGPPIHRRADYQTNNAEIAALAAPRPQLLVSCGKDWTKNVPTVEFPYIRNVYRLYGKADAVANAHFATEGHDYGKTKRRPVYRFLQKHLELPGTIDESKVTVRPRSALLCFDSQHPVPKTALAGRETILEAFRALQKRPEKSPKSPKK